MKRAFDLIRFGIFQFIRRRDIYFNSWRRE